MTFHPIVPPHITGFPKPFPGESAYTNSVEILYLNNYVFSTQSAWSASSALIGEDFRTVVRGSYVEIATGLRDED